MDYKSIFEIINGLVSNGTISSDDGAVHETIAKLFRSTVDVEYNQEDTDDIVEDFTMAPVNGETLTQDSLDVLNNNMIGGE